jgi:uncharacterized DUF497 family protein
VYRQISVFEVGSLEEIPICEWDPHKEARNVRERGLSFAEAMRVFLDERHITLADNRRDYGEPRFLTFGMVDGRLLAVGHTPRGDVTRIFSARKANRREQRRHALRMQHKESH